MFFAAGMIGLMTTLQQPVWGAEGGAKGSVDFDHPLVPVVRRVITGESGKQPSWKLPMVLNGLRKRPITAICTTYCEKCSDGGGRGTRWGTRLRRGIVAADPRYWGPGSVIYIGPPVDEVLIVEDTGGAVKGANRFDVCVTGHHALCTRWGKFKATYVPLHRTQPRRRWGRRPAGWHPPQWDLTTDLVRFAAQRVPSVRSILMTLLAEAPGDLRAG